MSPMSICHINYEIYLLYPLNFNMYVKLLSLLVSTSFSVIFNVKMSYVFCFCIKIPHNIFICIRMPLFLIFMLNCPQIFNICVNLSHIFNFIYLMLNNYLIIIKFFKIGKKKYSILIK